MKITTLRRYGAAIRPQLLCVLVATQVLATAMAFGDGIEHFPTAGIVALTAVLIHIGFALLHAYADYRKYVPVARDLNPRGLVTASVTAFLVSIPFITYCIARVGRPLLIGAVAMGLCVALYTLSRYCARTWFAGECVAVMMFGVVPVALGYYIQSFELTGPVIISGIAPGLFAVGIITANNICDHGSDRERGKHTTATRFGITVARYEYFLSIIGACLVPIAVYLVARDYRYALFATGSLLTACAPLRLLMAQSDAESCSRAALLTLRLMVVYSVLFAAGWVVTMCWF